jgi:hypothetical protein
LHGCHSSSSYLLPAVYASDCPIRKGQKTSINVAKKHKKADPRGPALKGGGRVAFRPLKINEK